MSDQKTMMEMIREDREERQAFCAGLPDSEYVGVKFDPSTGYYWVPGLGIFGWTQATKTLLDDADWDKTA